MVSASRAEYQLFMEPVGKGDLVVQQCRNRLCVDPDHLELVEHIPLDFWHGE